MMIRSMKTVAASLNRLSLLFAMAFAVIATAFRCSALWFRCYRITAKNTFKRLINSRNISNKIAEKAPEKTSFPVLSLFRPDNSVNAAGRQHDPVCVPVRDDQEKFVPLSFRFR